MKPFRDLKSAISEIYKQVDIDRVMRETAELTALELGQTFPCYARAAEYTYGLLKADGFDAELLSFPADGLTDYADKRTPIAWDVSVARAEIKSSPLSFDNPVIADYAANPLSVVKHSTSTAKGGIDVRLVTEGQVYAGADCRGAMVLLESESAPRSAAISPLLDLGAIGFLTDFLPCAADTPDCVAWVNGAVDDVFHWHVQSEDRDFIGFSLTPRVGARLRAAVNLGEVSLHVECDGRRYAGEINAVTATLPGKNKRELWVLAHLFEPLATDNSAGVISAIESLRQIRKMTEEGLIDKPEYTLRVVFAMEFYGFAAVAEHFGGYLGERTIGAINLDAMDIDRADNEYKLYSPPYSSPFCGSYVLRSVLKAYESAFPNTERVAKHTRNFGDDTFLGDSTTGMPTVWALHNINSKNSYHHNSVRDMNFIIKEKHARAISLTVLFLISMLAPSEDALRTLEEDALGFARLALSEAEEKAKTPEERAARLNYVYNGERLCLLDFEKLIGKERAEALAARLEAPAADGQFEPTYLTPWQKYAKGIVAKRLTVGFPHDLVKLPKEKRKILPDATVYGAMATILSALDGKRDLYTVIREAFWDFDRSGSDKEYKQYVDAILYLADAGYVSVENPAEITVEDVLACLARLGLKEGDTVALHSSLSGAGHIDGGAKTVINAFLKTLGKDGTLIAPTFTRPYIAFEGSLNKAKNFRPFSPDNISNISTGAIPKTMLTRFGAKRSANATHSFAGIGKNADYCLSAHGLLDSPASESSPLARACEIGGKVVFFACGVSPNTYLHCLEHNANSAFLDNATIKYFEENGKLRTAVIPKHLPGCRDFYGKKTPEAKFYKRAIERGIDIKCEPLGIGFVYKMELKELKEIGTELFREDPNVTLCDSPDCGFCKKFRT